MFLIWISESKLMAIVLTCKEHFILWIKKKLKVPFEVKKGLKLSSKP